MIDLRKALIFTKHAGDIDSWMASGVQDDISALEEGDWAEMEAILGSLRVQKQNTAGLAAREQGERTFTPMSENDANEADDYARRFEGIIKDDEYEAVVGEIYRLA